MKKNTSSIIKIIFMIFTAALMIVRARETADAVKDAIKLCAGTVVPSMLPFLTLTAYISRSGMLSFAGKPFDFISNKLFRQPGEALCIFLMSMTGGFPVGAKMILSACEGGNLSKDQAKRLAVFCFGGGPAFIINTAGIFTAGSLRAGVIFLISLVMSSLITGFITRFFAKNDFNPGAPAVKNLQKSSLAESVEDAVKTMTNICGWIIIFSAFGSIVSAGLPQSAGPYFAMIAEVTNGCKAAVKNFSLPVSTFVLGFGGLCVHCQILPYISRIGLPYRVFLCARVFSAAAACMISFFLFRLFPCDTPAFSADVRIVPVAWSVSFPAAAAFIFTVSLIILELAPKQKV